VSPSEVAACYRLYAACCAEIAQRASDQNRTLSLFNLVWAWLRLAEQVFRPEAATAKAKQ
jgi:hypothetical protein